MVVNGTEKKLLGTKSVELEPGPWRLFQGIRR